MDFRDRAHAQAIFDQQMYMAQNYDPGWSRGLMNEAEDAVINFDASLDPFSFNSIKGALGLPVNMGDAVAAPPTQNVFGGRVDVDFSVLDDLEAKENQSFNSNPTKTSVDTTSSNSPAMLDTDENGEGSFLDRTLGSIGDAAGGSLMGTAYRVGTDPDLPGATRAVGAALPLFTAMMPGFGGSFVGGIGAIANALGYHQDLNAPGTYGLSMTPAGNLSGQTQDGGTVGGGGFVQSGDLNVSNALSDERSNQYMDTPFGAMTTGQVAGLYSRSGGANPFASEEDFTAAGGESNPYSADDMAPEVDIGSAVAGLSDKFDLDKFTSRLGDFDATNENMNTFNIGQSYNAIAGAVMDAGGGYNDIAPAIEAAQAASRDAVVESQMSDGTEDVHDFSGADTYNYGGSFWESGGYVDAAQDLASQGRGGDTMLMHMRPDEVAGMAATGTVTQNPTTGLPENFLGSGIGAFLGPALGAALFPAIGPAGIALATGLGAGAGQTVEAMALGAEDPLRQGMMAGLTAGVGSYALSGLGSALGGTAKGTATKGMEGFGNKLVKMQGGPSTQATPSMLGLPGDGVSISDAFVDNVTDMPFSAPFSLGGLGSSMANANKSGIEITPTSMGGAPEKKTFSRTARYQPSGDFREYGFNPQQQFFGAGQYYNEGGLAQGESMATQLTEQAISAIRGDHPEPQIAVSRYVEEFGEEAFTNLRGLVIQEDQMMDMAETDNGLLRGSDGGRDDLRRGTIDGDQDVRIASGEYIFSADDVALAGDGNTEAGARRLDLVRRNLRKKATGTEKRPDYVGEEGVEEVFEEVMTA